MSEKARLQFIKDVLGKKNRFQKLLAIIATLGIFVLLCTKDCHYEKSKQGGSSFNTQTTIPYLKKGDEK